MPEEICEVIVTAPDAEWLAEFTRRLVEDRLTACGHLSTPIRSIYRWQDQIDDTTEARVALHTRRSLVSKITERAQAEHPYEVPCVLALDVLDGSADYLQWVRDQTEPSAASDGTGGDE